ncbi:MAG: efflux RND transporter periplasmic adaptor subunit [Acidobacteriota bacterium]
MSRLRLLLLLLALLVAAFALWLYRRNTAPPEVEFAQVARETLVSTLPTNGKVEPSDWVSVRAERAGIVERVDVQRGQTVARGALIAELDARDERADVSSAEAAVSQAKAQLQTIEQGGPAASQVEISNEMERDKLELGVAERDWESLKRLAQRQAATQQEVAEAAQRVQKLQASIEALNRKRGALTGPADRASALARVRETEAALEQARARLERSHIHSPMAGVVYELPVREGMYVNVGDLIANVGNLRQLRVSIYVDEPELGRVAEGMPVNVTWDALPGRVWKGRVEKLPTHVAPLGTRQVGEVLCTIENDDARLLPGTNVNAEIVSQVVENGVTIPKEAIRTENGHSGVYLLRGDRVEWRPITLGASSITRAVVTSGLAAGDRVALRTEQPLKNGQPVRVK